MSKSKIAGNLAAEKFEFVIVEPVPCPAEEAETHIQAFIEQFVAKDIQPRWLELLVEKPFSKAGQTITGSEQLKHRRSAEKLLDRFAFHGNHQHCELLKGTQAWPLSLRRLLGDVRGVYFDLTSEPCKMTAAEAATKAFESYAILSFDAGRKALLFDHEGVVWWCAKSR